MERFTYALFCKDEGSFAYGSDLAEMIESCDEYRANGYSDTVVKRQITGEIVYPHPSHTFQITAESHPDIWAILQPPALLDKEES